MEYYEYLKTKIGFGKDIPFFSKIKLREATERKQKSLNNTS